MHLYLGSAKVGTCRQTDRQTDRQMHSSSHFPSQVAEGQSVTDHRFFIRTIVRHSDFVTRVRRGKRGWRGVRGEG